MENHILDYLFFSGLMIFLYPLITRLLIRSSRYIPWLLIPGSEPRAAVYTSITILAIAFIQQCQKI